MTPPHLCSGLDEIRAALDSFVKSYEPTGVVSEEVGRVTLTADGIAQVEGLPGAMANELLRFEDGTLGLALNLDVREIGVVVLGEFTGIEEGQEVRRTGEVLSVPIGDGYRAGIHTYRYNSFSNSLARNNVSLWNAGDSTNVTYTGTGKICLGQDLSGSENSNGSFRAFVIYGATQASASSISS